MAGFAEYAASASIGVNANYASQAPVAAPPSVGQRIDSNLEASTKLSFALGNLLAELHQQVIAEKSVERSPSRSGLDGKLADTSDRLEESFKTVLLLREYLLGN